MAGKNETEATLHLKLACEGGARLGCSTYAAALEAGKGVVAADPAAAVAVLERACDRGHWSFVPNAPSNPTRARSRSYGHALEAYSEDHCCWGTVALDCGRRLKIASSAMRLSALWSILVCAAVGACATYREDLNRGQRLYEENQYEHALAIWRSLETDTDSLTFNDQARYAYLRGMTDYRLGFRPDARHWLAVAKATEQEHPGGLNPEWKERLGKSLDELNHDVYGGADKLGKGEVAEPAADASANDAPGN